ncbi:Uma2 family endonuclease [Limnoglobus roseus]|uniref:Uma2 family endonuclease n=1 Tax=Limnoglobus roseus TaxID=2598579 RepID=A0A5C1AG96_9BACT|nr:Uma2 family endonuclease [Limnoglobus roseus]QEL17263.1 Uma2 family endonuclease [Limnoglobus roseus]
MSTTMPAPPRMAAVEFLRLYGDESGYELVNGIVVKLPMTGGVRGEVCGNVASLIGDHIKEKKLGRVMSNDTYIRTRTNPDGVRTADVCFISYAILPADQPTPAGPLTPPLELVVEVKSSTDCWNAITLKSAEYIAAGVVRVLVLDPETASATIYHPDELPQRFHNGDELTLPEVLPGFAVPVARFFE